MIPTFRHDVTLWHRNGAQINVIHLKGCAWAQSIVRNTADNTATERMETTCRIPAGQTAPCIGDVMALGTYTDAPSSEIELNRMMSAKKTTGVQCFKVTTVQDNTAFCCAKHYKAVGA